MNIQLRFSKIIENISSVFTRKSFIMANECFFLFQCHGNEVNFSNFILMKMESYFFT